MLSFQANGADASRSVLADMLSQHGSTRVRELSLRRNQYVTPSGQTPEFEIHRNLVRNRGSQEIQSYRRGVECGQECRIDAAIAERERVQDGYTRSMRTVFPEKGWRTQEDAEKFLSGWEGSVEFHAHSDRTKDTSSPRGTSLILAGTISWDYTPRL